MTIEKLTTRDAARRRFVVLFHEHPADGNHFDLMIDAGSSLTTWRIDRPPESATTAADVLACRRIGEHRRVYLDYEGPVSGDRGTVKQHDAGHCTSSTLEAACIAVQFEGKLLRGEFILERDDGSQDQWRLRLA